MIFRVLVIFALKFLSMSLKKGSNESQYDTRFWWDELVCLDFIPNHVHGKARSSYL